MIQNHRTTAPKVLNSDSLSGPRKAPGGEVNKTDARLITLFRSCLALNIGWDCHTLAVSIMF